LYGENLIRVEKAGFLTIRPSPTSQGNLQQGVMEEY
jgi:hypothetical protein